MLVIAFRPGDRGLKQSAQQSTSSGVTSSTNCWDPVSSSSSGKLTHRVNLSAAESVTMTTPSQSQCAKSSSLSAIGSSQLQPVVGLLIFIVIIIIIIMNNNKQICIAP